MACFQEPIGLIRQHNAIPVST